MTTRERSTVNKARLADEKLDALIEEATVDAHDESEQLWARAW